MKRTHLQKVLSLILALLFLFSVTSCKENENLETTLPPVAPPTAELDPTAPFAPTSQYNIVYGTLYEHSNDIDEATSYLSAALQTVYGVDCNVKNDTYSKQTGYQPAKFEILIGDTNRTQSQSLYATLGVDDYAYSVESAYVVVICGGSPEATLQAVRQFCTDVFRYGEEPSAQPLWIPGTEDSFCASYDYSSATFNGESMANVTVATKNHALYSEAAFSIARTLGEYTGKPVSIVPFAQLTGMEEIVICVGGGTKTGSSTIHFNGYRLASNEYDGKFSVYLEATSAVYMEQVKELFLETLENVPNGETIALSFPTSFDQSYIEGTDFWTLDSQTETEISDGVIYREFLYYDEFNKPYRMYMLDVDTTKNTFHMGTADDGYGYTVEQANRETVQEHMQAAVANGLDVIAGVNADFFDMQGDYHPRGLAVKSGQLIGQSNNRAFFAVSKDGTPYIDTVWNDSDLATTQTAVGGNPLLLENGLPVAKLQEDTSVHPRTVAGIRADGSVILIVIDGRQETHSNGATFYQCALLLRQMGAVSAINLDGGGSSTMITRDGDTYTTMNSPSDGSLRKVYNSLLVVKKG